MKALSSTWSVPSRSPVLLLLPTSLEALPPALWPILACTGAVQGLYCLALAAAYRSGDLGPAERRVSAYLELHSADLDMSFTLAGLRCQLGDRAGAQQMIERIELFDPEFEGLAELRQKVSGL